MKIDLSPEDTLALYQHLSERITMSDHESERKCDCDLFPCVCVPTTSQEARLRDVLDQLKDKIISSLHAADLEEMPKDNTKKFQSWFDTQKKKVDLLNEQNRLAGKITHDLVKKKKRSKK